MRGPTKSDENRPVLSVPGKFDCKQKKKKRRKNVITVNRDFLVS